MKRTTYSTIILVPCLLLIASAFSLHASAQNAGDLDLSFGDGGTVLFDFGTGQDNSGGLLIQPDQKIVMAGKTLTTSYRPTLIRVNTDGTPDDSFGENGIAFGDRDFFFWDAPADLLVMQPDGKLLMAYQATVEGQLRSAVSRFNTDGSIDTDFGEEGTATNWVSEFNDLVHSMVLQQDGKIVVVGQAQTYIGSNYSMIATRFNSDGSVDETFADNSIFLLDYSSGDDRLMDVKQQSDGKILMVGQGTTAGYNNCIFIRLNEDGSYDETYGADGIANFNLNDDYSTPTAVVLRDDDSAIATGIAALADESDVFIMCVTPDGELDPTFGTEGVTITHISDEREYGDNLTLASDGKILVAGYQSAMTLPGLVLRYTADGQLDPTFNGDGVAFIEAYGYYLENIKQQADGKIVVTGRMIDDTAFLPDFAVSRLLYEDANVVEEISGNNAISIFPNPANETLTLNCYAPTGNEIVDISIADISGAIVWRSQSASFHQKQIATSQLVAGVYSIVIQGSSIHSTKRFVIAR